MSKLIKPYPLGMCSSLYIKYTSVQVSNLSNAKCSQAYYCLQLFSEYSRNYLIFNKILIIEVTSHLCGVVWWSEGWKTEIPVPDWTPETRSPEGRTSVSQLGHSMLKAEDQCPSSHRQAERRWSQPSAFLFYSGLQQIGRYPRLSGRALCVTQSTNSNSSLLWKQPQTYPKIMFNQTRGHWWPVKLSERLIITSQSLMC